MHRWTKWAVVLTLFSAMSGVSPAKEQPAAVPTLAPMLEKVLPGVVSIAIKGHVPQTENPLLDDPFFRRFFGVPEGGGRPQERAVQAAGSGVIVDAANGHILTNNHVVENAEEITVVFSDDRRVKAERIGTDPATDLAVLQAESGGLHELPLGNSNDLKVGDYVVAVGNPFGLAQTATLGIVSALGRTGLGIEGYEDFIQTDASINPGNSGGALVNLQGELVGINSAIIGPAGGNVGIGFAIPIDLAQVVMRELIDRGEIQRGQLGVTIQDVTPDLAEALGLDRPEGALVNQVAAGSPAETAGIRAGDVIVGVDGETVGRAADLKLHMGLARIGSQLQIDLVRDGETMQLTAELTKPADQRLSVPADVPLLAGEVLEATDTGPSDARGVRVADIDPDGPAGRAGLSVGDVIVSVDQQPVDAPDEVLSIARSSPNALLLQVMRDSGMIFIAIV